MGRSIFWLLISGVGRNSVFSRWKIQITSAVWWRRPVNQLSAFVQGRDVFTAPAGELTAIGETGILHWMEAYTSQDVVTWYRMDNCQAQQVSLVAGDASEFCVSARLSYQSYSPAHLSANGLGQQLEGGAIQWDDCYTEFRIVARGGDQYEILTTGTGGGGQGLVPGG